MSNKTPWSKIWKWLYFGCHRYHLNIFFKKIDNIFCVRVLSVTQLIENICVMRQGDLLGRPMGSEAESPDGCLHAEELWDPVAERRWKSHKGVEDLGWRPGSSLRITGMSHV